MYLKLAHYENEFFEDISRLPEDITAENIMSYCGFAYKRTAHYGEEIKILCKTPLEFMVNYNSMNSTLIFNLSLLKERIERRLSEIKKDILRIPYCNIFTIWKTWKELRVLSKQYRLITETVDHLNKLLDIMYSSVDINHLHDMTNIHEEKVKLDGKDSDGLVWVDLL